LVLWGLGLFLLGSGALWLFTGKSSQTNTPTEALPVIQADPDLPPLKTRSNQDATADIPHKDKLIYQEFAPADQAEVKVENLLEMPEEPMSAPPVAAVTEEPLQEEEPEEPGQLKQDRLSVFDAVPSEAQPTPETSQAPTTPQKSRKNIADVLSQTDADITHQARQMVLDNLEKERPMPILESKPRNDHIPIVSEIPAGPSREAIAKAQQAQPIVKEKPQAPEKAAPEPQGPKTFWLQIGTLPNRDQALSEWERLRRKSALKPLWRGIEVQIEKKELSVGTRYALYVGPYTKQAAQEACSALSAEKVGCRMVRLNPDE
jgi:hypothetical protein